MIATLAAAPAVIVGVLEDDGEEEEDGEEETGDTTGPTGGTTGPTGGTTGPTGGTTGPTGDTTGPTGVAVERKTSELCESGEAPIALMARIAIL